MGFKYSQILCFDITIYTPSIRTHLCFNCAGIKSVADNHETEKSDAWEHKERENGSLGYEGNTVFSKRNFRLVMPLIQKIYR